MGQASQSKTTLNQLQGTGVAKALTKKLQLPCSHPNSAPTMGGGKTNRLACTQGCQPLGKEKTPAIV
jgi:hypothetical protein